MLVLPIKRKWFDMIRSGEKKEEYREIKQYYKSRFQNAGMLDQFGKATASEEWIIFRNGYSADAPEIKAKCRLRIKTGRLAWGAEPGKIYYALHIKSVVDLTY